MNRPSVVFLTPPVDTFTPTRSGALATIIHECAQLARREGLNPLVVAREAQRGIPSYSDLPLLLLPYPEETWRRGRLNHRLWLARRKLFGLRLLGQNLFLARLTRLVARHRLHEAPLVMINDPEGAIHLHQRFPNARIVHFFQNQLDARPRVRQQYKKHVFHTVACSEFTRAWNADYYQLQPATTKVVFNGVNLDQFRPLDSVPGGPPIFNFVGRTGIEKAPDTFLEAARLLSEERRDFGVQLVGANYWGPRIVDEFQLRLIALVENIERNGVSVRQTGHVDRMAIADEFRRAHVHVVPSRWDEPFGLTTVEGMATGLATVASNTGGTPEVVGDAGLLFERDRPDELAAHLRFLLDQPDARRDYARRARDRAQEFSWRRTWEGLKAAAQL